VEDVSTLGSADLRAFLKNREEAVDEQNELREVGDSRYRSSADFTPNPGRAIWVEGPLDERLLEHLRPQILKLTAHDHKPITVFIDSAGGDVEVLESILRLLRRTTTENPRVSRIITVAAPRAKSAAARLLSAGDFAIAYRDSALFYHGTFYPLAEPALDGESGMLLARTVPTLQERAASSLAQNSVHRFKFIASIERSRFADYRTRSGDPALTDLECLQGMLRRRLSPAGQAVLERARTLAERYNALLIHFQKRLKRGRNVTAAHLRKLMQHASVDFEHESTNGSSTWDGGWGEITEHFYFLNEYFRNENDDGFRGLRDWIACRETQQAAGADDVDAAYFLPFQFFFHALCRALQKGDRYLTPTDALWLGLLDTVRDDVAAPSRSARVCAHFD
jgi:ATP-dependent protease ClpP protease subunit